MIQLMSKLLSLRLFYKTKTERKKFTFLWLSSTRTKGKGVLLAQPGRAAQGLPGRETSGL